jgi:hypothetical protein
MVRQNPFGMKFITSKKRSKILNWLLRVQERCKISDIAFYRALTMFDKVCETLADAKNDPFEISATCLYLSSK